MDLTSNSWIMRFREWAARRSYLANAVRLGGGGVIAQGLILLATPAITRLYSPSDIGLAGLFSSFLLVASTLACVRYEGAIGVAPAEERGVLTLLSCWLTVPVASLATLTLAGLIAMDARGFGQLPYSCLPAMLVLTVMTGMFAALRSLFVARKDFSGIASALIRQGVGRALCPILVAPLGWGWFGLLAGEAAGRGLGLADFFRAARPTLASARRLGLRHLIDCLVRYRQFPLSYVPGVLLDALAAALPMPIIAGIYGIADAGLFALAQRVILFPSALICGALADVCQTRLVDGARSNPQTTRPLLRSGALLLGGTATALYVPIAALAWVAFPWVFGREWAHAGAIAAALVPFAISGVVTNPLSRALLISRIPQVKLISDVFRVALPSGALYLAGTAGFSLEKAALLYALFGLVADALYFGVIVYSVAPHRQRELR